MTSLMVIENKISFIRKQLGILENYKKYSLEELSRSEELQAALERRLYLVTQATIDLAEAVVAYRSFRKPTTYSEAFDILCEEALIERDLCEKLVKMTGFRNRIAHAYENMNMEVIYDVLQNGMPDIKAFIIVIGNKFNL